MIKAQYVRLAEDDHILLGMAGLVLLGLVTGLAIIISSTLAWLTFGVILGIALLGLPSYIWAGIAVLSAIASRLAVSTGVIPPIVNFFHFPLVLGGAIVAVSRRTIGYSSLSFAMAKGLCAILFVSLLSWAINGGELMRPFFAWIVFCEPFLLIFCLIKEPPPQKIAQRMWFLILALAFLQLPLGVGQLFRYGFGDKVQGTFVNMGAGAHVAAGVVAAGVLICLSKALEKGAAVSKYAAVIFGFVLSIFPLISDAKQVFVAFLLVLAIVLVQSVHRSFIRAAVIVLLTAATIYIVLSFLPLFRQITNWGLISRGFWGKIQAVEIVTQKMRGSSLHWLFGLGPGNSVSRVALLSAGGLVEKASPVAFLNFHLAPTTRDIIQLAGKSDPLFGLSSIWTGISSWLGLFGDFGITGFIIYIWMGMKLWFHIRRRQDWKAIAATSALLMAAILGALFSWLEEPGFTLAVALMAGLASGEMEDKHARLADT